MTTPSAWPVRSFHGFSLCQFVLQVKRPGSLAQRARQFVDATRLSGKRAPSWRGFNDSLSPRVARASLALQGREILQEMAAPEWTPRCSASSSPLSPPCSPPHSPLGCRSSLARPLSPPVGGRPPCTCKGHRTASAVHVPGRHRHLAAARVAPSPVTNFLRRL